MKWQLPQSISRAAALLTDAVAPPRCIHCLREGSWHCKRCQGSWRLGPLSCIVCKRSQRDGRTCRGCQDETPLQGLLAAGSYGSVRLRRGIHWLKFRSVKAVALPLAWLTVPQLRHIAPLPTLQQSGVLLPIALHPRRQRQRGFNQAQELAYAISCLTDIPCMTPLVRSRATHRQTSLPVTMREANVAGAFVCRENTTTLFEGKRYIILVDDVTTSGSTLNAAAKALKLNDNQQLWGLVIARG